MTDPTGPVLQDLNTGLLISAAALVGLGAALGLAGFGVGAAAVAIAARGWYRRNDLTPVHHAKLALAQARAAGAAGADAWKRVDRSQYTRSAAR